MQAAADPEDKRVPRGTSEEEGGSQGAPPRVPAPRYLLTPIGKVISVNGDVSEIEVYPEFSDGLYRIELLKELDVLFVFDRSEGYDLEVHPKGDETIPLTGLFGTRSPRRPSPIGLTRVTLLERRGNVLKVKGLDTFVDTPVADIKGVMGKGFSWDPEEMRRMDRRASLRRAHK
ncbi:MAG: TrmO family methyltransferase [Methanomassiliicoccales archaeon]